jgi:hypothetical protein
VTDDPLDFGKQAKNIADAANVSVDAVTKLGTFVDNIFGNAIKNGLGLIGDKLAYYRLERAIELQLKVEKRLKEKGVNAKRYVPVSFGLPIFERATIEEDDELQQLANPARVGLVYSYVPVCPDQNLRMDIRAN